MAKNQPQTPLVTSVSTTLRKTIQPNSTQICSPEEIKEKKQSMMKVVDKSLQLFEEKLMAGKIPMNSSADLERLIKLQLLLSGEADSRIGKPYGEVEQESVVNAQTASLSMSKIEEILQLDDPEVKKMYDRLFDGYNSANDIEE